MSKTVDEILKEHGAEEGEFTYSLKAALQALVEEALREVIGEAEAPIVNDPISDHDRVIRNRLREIEQQGRIPQVISKMFGDTK